MLHAEFKPQCIIPTVARHGIIAEKPGNHGNLVGNGSMRVPKSKQTEMIAKRLLLL
ncbi:hypothetical protein HMPREF9999_01445 [Alloprevotella sp. oral taxon 473 str. F0040]|nr:hypothetical protein HMPREF9999_01445 [Alloprevotella sp. oral taxon 473 str. F0040]